MLRIITNSPEETEQIAMGIAKSTEIGKLLGVSPVIGFVGELGAGKTAFTRGFVRGLGIEAEVSSPTFAICNEYIGNGARVLHYDMYRVESWDDLESVGFFDALDSDAYVLCEWSENIFAALPDDAQIIKIEKDGDTTRVFTVYPTKDDFLKEQV